jgi:hypothetical protein
MPMPFARAKQRMPEVIAWFKESFGHWSTSANPYTRDYPYVV